MNPAIQTQEKSVQPGSSRYYSLFFLPATTREAATSLYRLANELNTLGSTSSEAAGVHSLDAGFPASSPADVVVV